MFNKNDKIHKRGIKKIDAIVTGMLLGGIVASIYGIKKTTKHFEEKHKSEEKHKEEQEQHKSRFRQIMKMLVFWVQEPTIEKKKGLFSRLFKK